MRVEVKNFQYIKNTNGNSEEDDDHDDFYEESSEHEEAPAKNRPSTLAKLMCSMTPLMNNKIKESLSLEAVKEQFQTMISRARHNDWYTFNEIEHNFHLLQAGIEIK